MKSIQKIWAELSAKEASKEVELSEEKVDLSIDAQMKEYMKLANDVEQMGKDLYANQNKAENLLKQANNLLEPVGNFMETQIQSALKDLESAGLKSSDAYRELASSIDYLERANATTKRMSKAVAQALN